MKIGITGATGKMGLELLKLIAADNSLKLSRAVTGRESNFIGYDSGDLTHSAKTGVKLNSDYEDLFANSDIIIDFSAQEAMSDILDAALKYKKPLVSGTTGLTKEDFAQLHKVSETVPILWSPNMSVAINLLAKLTELLALKLDSSYDTEIVESHHRHKKDAPSGTALMLGQVIADARKIDFEQYAIFDRQTKQKPRDKSDIGFSSIRAGGIYGEHNVIFTNEYEGLKISHTSYSRKIYADGAVKAAKWLAKQQPFLYSMNDFLSD